ncbi:rRNA maturation RNase YbeY [Eubacterium oxidoreducens]|uniref:Endoribonuclease YbeY n=1 Tax=Eubacterium oxidoreducens TaxID=1732 RepID=A0A1G6ALY0_EUBOX|nr:rRNA maturation RNase YbeY [Eubacterium oxidoreducens]SDB09143.1 probable rRNA maturation factor [Eubacterium oxidoreducens]
MTVHIEEEVEIPFDFDYKQLADRVIEACIDYVNFPFEAEVNILLVDDKMIQEINAKQRNIDKATDVLSFPMLDYEQAGDFSKIEENSDNFHPETGECLLGDIVISVDKVLKQAQNYGHSAKREYAFLITHSMFHLFGYDHMTSKEEEIMFAKQASVLKMLQINR